MGACIKCGKETKNYYTYYSADRTNTSSQKTGNSFSATTTATQPYTNITQCFGYLCSNHKSVIHRLYISYLLFLVFATIVASTSIILLYDVTTKIKILFSIIIATKIISLFFIFRYLRRKHNDIYDENKAASIIIKEMRKKYPGQYFTPAMYADLRRS